MYIRHNHIEFFIFKLDQTVSLERVLYSLAIQQNPTHKKKLSTYNFWSQTNIEFCYQTKWNLHKENSNGTTLNV